MAQHILGHFFLELYPHSTVVSRAGIQIVKDEMVGSKKEQRMDAPKGDQTVTTLARMPGWLPHLTVRLPGRWYATNISRCPTRTPHHTWDSLGETARS